MPGKAGMQRRKATEKTDRHQIWMAMRILRTFTAPQICTASGAKLNNTQRYLKRLETHGFVRAEGPRATGLPGVHTQYRLVRDIGPDHPVRCESCGKSLAAKTCKEDDDNGFQT